MVQAGPAEGNAQKLDGVVVGRAVDRERRTVLAAVGEGKTRRIARAGAGAVDQLGDQGQRPQALRA